MRRILLAAALAISAVAAAPAQAELQAGAANADLTPPIGTPMFAYTARSGALKPDEYPLQIVADPDSGMYAKSFVASRGIHTRVRARTIVLDTGSKRLALIQVDLGGIPYALVQRVGELIGETGIPLENVMIAATHTHSSTGPIWPTDSTGYAALGGDAYDARIFEFTAQAVARSIIVANSYKVPAKLGIATSRVKDASRNRNVDPFRRNPEAPKDEAAAREAAVDRLLTVVRVDETDGTPIGVWSNFAAHQTSFGDDNLLFSGDNAAFTERIVEAELRRTARKRGTPPRRAETVVNVWTNGAEGDISPSGSADVEPMEIDEEPKEGEKPPKPEQLQYTGNSSASAHMAGLKIARGVLRAWRRAGRSMSADVPIDSRLGFIAFDGQEADGEPVGPLAILGRGGVAPDPFGPDGTCAEFENQYGPGQGWKAFALGGPGGSIVPGTQPVSVMKIGSLGIAAFPSEITKQMGLRIRNAVKAGTGDAFSHVALAGLANGYSSYTSTPEEYDACHYEGSFTLFGRRQGPLYRDVAVAIAKALVAGTPYEGDPEPASAAGAPSEFPPSSTTPQAGTAIEQPPASVTRYGRVKFSWHGGHATVDAPRARAMVTTERMRKDGTWRRWTTDDGFYDILERAPESDIWTTTLQTTDCMRAARFRFVIRGRADRGDGPEDYKIESKPFDVKPIANLEPTLTVTGRQARVTALYPNPGEDSLMALPRRVRSGHALLGVKKGRGKERRVRAGLTEDGLAFGARVPRGATVRVIRVTDACGNTGA